MLLRLAPADERILINRIKQVAQEIQNSDAALLLADRVELVARSGADGAHLHGVAALQEVVTVLKPDRIAGVGGLKTRDDAMRAGEIGADYVMFGEPSADGWRPAFDAIIDRVTWWTELFEIPCVAYADNLDEIAALTAAGAEFIGWEAVFSDARGIAAALAEAARRGCRRAPEHRHEAVSALRGDDWHARLHPGGPRWLRHRNWAGTKPPQQSAPPKPKLSPTPQARKPAPKPQAKKTPPAASSATAPPNGEADVAFGAYQRGYYLTAFREATKRVEERGDPRP